MSKLTPYAIWSLTGQCPAWKDKRGLMTSIALAESSGETTSENTCCVGLWQVNVLVHTQYTRQQMKDPLQNVRAACAIYQSQGLKAWESYTNGAYKNHTKEVEDSLRHAGVNEDVKGVGTLGFGVGPTIAPEASEKLGEAVEGAVSWTKELGQVLAFISTSQGWVRIGKVVLGSALLLIALSELTKTSVPTPPVAKTVKAVKAARSS